MSEASQSYSDACAELYALVPRGIVLGLETMQSALDSWGNPQRKLPAVHVAGTNGKGSVSAMVDAALRASGLRVGLYTSPHLHHFAERIRVGGAPANEVILGDSIRRVLAAMESRQIPMLTFFEATTLVAWDVFSRSRLDRVVLEVGLGGRLDATTVCNPDVTAITRIALDHESKLGTTIDAIAREKAGILKPAIPCVVGPDLRAGIARDAINEIAAKVGSIVIDAPHARVRSFGSDLRAKVEVDARDGSLVLDLALGGPYQVGNAAVAVGVLESLGIARDAIQSGLESTIWPARMERIENLLFDAAHNPDGVAALIEGLDRLPYARDSRVLVFGASSDKDWRSMLDLLGSRFELKNRYFCAATLRRAEDPSVLASHAGGTACGSVAEAIDRAKLAAGTSGLVVVCGSIFTVSEARAHVLHINADPPVAM